MNNLRLWITCHRTQPGIVCTSSAQIYPSTFKVCKVYKPHSSTKFTHLLVMFFWTGKKGGITSSSCRAASCDSIPFHDPGSTATQSIMNPQSPLITAWAL